MNENENILGFQYIREQLMELASTEQVKKHLQDLMPYMKEAELRKNMRETTEARELLNKVGAPPIPAMLGMEELVTKAVSGDLLLPEDMENVGSCLAAVRRLKDYLKRGQRFGIGLSYYSENLSVLEELEKEIVRCIRNGRVDDYASQELRDIRRKKQILEEKVKAKAESVMKANKSAMSDQFIVNRSGHICLPVKRDQKGKVKGSVIDQSATGTTLFIEPEAVAYLSSELEMLLIEEDTEERKILYTLMNEIANEQQVFAENMEMITRLDFIFAKGKLSANLHGVEPELHMERSIRICKGRHPQLNEKECVPLDFEMNVGTRGMIITGPNTGGKTVAIKTVGLLSMMAGCGLHVPCESAEICMFNQILCDIGDGQNITDNLSTFSAHITNVIDILNRVTKESLVILDELGSGTDPLEGMGIAIAILEELRKSGCMYLVTTHYPEVKEYANRYPEIMNARMAFDREQLKPLYRLEIGSAGESCALYIAKKLGLSDEMLRTATRESYGKDSARLEQELGIAGSKYENAQAATYDSNQRDERSYDCEKVERGHIDKSRSNNAPRLVPEIDEHKVQNQLALYHCGDSVIISPEGKIGIVVKMADDKGNVLVQLQKEKIVINHKRLKLKVAATELYPEDYDFSIIFDSVETRKARHRMGKGHDVGKSIDVEEY